MNDALKNFPRTVTNLHSLMTAFTKAANDNPYLILRELDRPEDDELKEAIMELARDARGHYGPIAHWYRVILNRAALKYAQRRVKEAENEPNTQWPEV